MASERAILYFTEPIKCKVLKVRVQEGWNLVPAQHVIVYEPISEVTEKNNGSSDSKKDNDTGSTSSKHTLHTFKPTEGGIVDKILVKPADIINYG